MGSSIWITRESKLTALAISTICCSATLSERTRWPGRMWVTPRSLSSSAVSGCIRAVSTRPRRRGSRPSQTFSATERSGSRLNSWKTVEMPACWACSGWLNETGSPASSMVPSSGA